MAGHRGWLRGYLCPRRRAAVAGVRPRCSCLPGGRSSFSSEEHDAVVQFDSIGIPDMDTGIELAAPSRGVLAWAVLRELGRAGVAAREERHVGFARHVAQRAHQHPRLELLLEPELSIVCFRYAVSDAVNAEILLWLRRTTRSMPSSPAVAGHLAIRPCFINPRTQLADVDALVDHVITIGDELARAGTRHQYWFGG